MRTCEIPAYIRPKLFYLSKMIVYNPERSKEGIFSFEKWINGR